TLERDSDLFLVIDDEDPTLVDLPRPRGRLGVADVPRARQEDPKDRALAEAALDAHLPSERSDNRLADREAEACADLGRLRRKERIKDTFEILLGNADAGIADLHDRASILVRAGDDGDRVRSRRTLGDRLCRIEEEVQEDLAEPPRVRF